MFGYSLIKTDELRGLKIIAAKYQMARKNSWWPHQAFVTRLLRRVTSGEHDMGSIRSQFDNSLAEYVKNGGVVSQEELDKIVKELHEYD